MRENLKLSVVAAPAIEPVTRAEVKSHTRIDGAEDDTSIDLYNETARIACEQYTGRALITRTYRLFLDRWPASGGAKWWDGQRQGALGTALGGEGRELRLPYGPVQSVAHIKSYSDADVASTLSSDNYYVDTVSFPGRIALRNGVAAPIGLRTVNAYEIQYDAGYGDTAADVPLKLRLGIMQYAAQLYENRGDEMAALKQSNAQALWHEYASLEIA